MNRYLLYRAVYKKINKKVTHLKNENTRSKISEQKVIQIASKR